MKRFLLSIVILTISYRGLAQFTPGNIVVSRVGDGSTALSNASAQVQLVEYTTAGVSTGIIVTLPVTTTNTPGNRACTNSGSSTTEGQINLSYDGRYLIHTGYDAIPGVAGISTSITDPNRTISRIDATGTVDISTSFLATTGQAYVRNSIRSAISSDGTQFWASGTSSSTNGGVRYLTLGQDNVPGTQISTTITNSRNIQIFNDQLYISAQSSTIRVGSVGTGTPITSGQLISSLPSFPTATLSPVGFIFFDRDAAIAGLDLLYFVSQSSIVGEFGLFKYSFDGANWNSQGKLADATTNNSQASGLTGYLDCSGNVKLYLTRATGATNVPIEIRTYTDNAAYNATMTSNGTSILSASALLVSAASNYAFRGFAMSPANGYSVTGLQSIAAGNYNIVKVKSGGTATLTGNIVVYDKIIVENGGTLDMGAFTISSPSGIGSSFEVQSGGSVKIGSADGITTSGATGNVQTCFRTYNSAANYEYNGTVVQATGNGLPSSLTGNLKIDNSSGISMSGVTLSQSTSISVAGLLNLTAAKLTTTSSNLITLNYTATSVLNASASSFISGPVKKIGTDDFIFPVGIGQIYAPIGISGSTNAVLGDEFTAEYIRTNPQGIYGFLYGSGINHISYVEYWTLDRNIGSTAEKIVSLDAHRTSFVLDPLPANTFVSKFDGTTWNKIASSASLVSCPASLYQCGTVTTTVAVTSFSPFTLATDQPFSANPLPIKLISFDAIKINATTATINWQLAACCSKQARFEALKSTDGNNYASVAAITGSETNTSYTYTDDKLGAGITYYRLKGIDADGKVSYSKVVAIINGAEGLVLTSLYPNPAQSEINISISSAKTEKVILDIYNLSGNKLLQWSQPVTNGNNVITKNTSGLKPGIYQLVITAANGKRIVQGFIKE